MTVRTNYVKNPSFEVDLTGYTTQGASATLARDTTTSWSGSASVKTTDSASNYRVLVWGATGAAAANSDSIAVTVGDSWAFSAYARWVTGGTSGNLTAKIHCFNSSGSWITDLQGSATTIPGTGAWTRVSVTGTIPANTAKIGVTLVTAGINTYNIDALLLEKSATVGAYFDGSTTSTGTDTYAWTGTANASTSTDTAVTSIPGSSSGTGTAVGKIALNPSQTAAGTVKPALGITGAQMATGTATGVPGLYTTASQTATGTASASLGLSVSQIASGAAGATLGGRLDVSQTATGTASGALSNHNHLSVSQTGTGSANGQIVLPTPGAQTAEGTAYAELFYTAPPTPLDAQPLQKLSDFTLSTSAVHTDPTQGAGSAATISAVFTAGPFPDAALGTEASFHNGAIGDWTGTVSQLRTVEGSAKVSVTVDTPVTKLAQEFRLYPHLPTTPSTATAAEAVDYWTQTCGVFYDKIDGDVCFYQSGYGHPYAYGEDLGNTKLYEKSYTPLYRAGRTALNFGSLSQCAMFEDSKARIDVSVTPNRKLVLSTAVTSGAAGTARFVFDDGRTLALTVSSGTVFLYCGSTILASVGITGEGRIWGSLEKVGGTSWAVRLSTSTGSDTGTLLMPVDFKPYSRLLRAEFEGTAGARYGTYLAVADAHPTAVPDVQKDLAATKKPLAFVPGFVGTVWDKMNEFGSVNRLDFSYENQMLTMRPRSSTLAFPANFDRLERTWTRVLKYRQVAVMDQQSKAVNTGDGLLYRSDSVISVKRGEVYETTVQTKHSILSVQNPVCVNGIEPFPYKGGNGATGQYVVTGADGYIVSPAYWNDNGGKVEVFLTENDGELKIRVTAPWPDSPRAPYRISEGEADRPALYICGSGVINNPVQRNISTGASSAHVIKTPAPRSDYRNLPVSTKPGAHHAREGYERVFDSPFCGTPDQVYTAAMGMASQYSAATAKYDFEIPNDWDTPTGLGQFPSGVVFPDSYRNARVLEAQQTASKVTGTAEAHTTFGMSQAARPSGAKYGDRIKGRTYRERNIYPLMRSTP